MGILPEAPVEECPAGELRSVRRVRIMGAWLKHPDATLGR
jgi:hypothetical protein